MCILCTYKQDYFRISCFKNEYPKKNCSVGDPDTFPCLWIQSGSVLVAGTFGN